jgi:hypothetical protein
MEEPKNAMLDSARAPRARSSPDMQFKPFQLKEYKAALRLHGFGPHPFPTQTHPFQQCPLKKALSVSKKQVLVDE